MKISHNWLQKYFKENIPSPETLADLFNVHAFEVEGAETVKEDTALDIKVLPDRAHYALCHRGIAKEIQAITQLKIAPIISQKSITNKNVSIPKVVIKNTDLCNRYVARKIENITVKTSPEHIKESLEVVGQRSINTIVDATNFVMLDVGQPLHAFDTDKVKGTIVVRFALSDETIELLDGKTVPLLPTDLVIADDAGPLAIAGVKGGKRAEVNSETKSIILESANFNASAVRKTSTRLGLRNESSKRFENEITPDLCAEAMEHVTTLIVELSPEAIASDILDIYPKPAMPWSVSVSPEDISSVIGVSVSAVQIQQILERMFCAVDTSDARFIKITPPLDRLDMKIPEDIADEVGRIYGYDKIPSVLPPKLVDNTPVSKKFYYAEKIKNILYAHGFSETLLYSLVHEDDGYFQIAYPLASDKSALRKSIAPKLYNAIANNFRNAELLELESVRIFEIGKVFPDSGERTSLCLGISITRKRKDITEEDILVKAIRTIEKEFLITIEYEKKEECTLGFNSRNRIFASIIETDFDVLVEKLPEPKDISDLHFTAFDKNKKYVPFSAYPFASRDIAVFVPTTVEEKELSEIIKKHAGSYLLKMKLFDVFKKDDKTSYAFRLIFQSHEKTLEEGEINAAMQAITDALVKEGWIIR